MDGIEKFIHTEYGYCYYTLDAKPKIYNLYVEAAFRRRGMAKKLIYYVIAEIRNSGYSDEIRIWPNPLEDSISLSDLTAFYKKMGLTVFTDNHFMWS